MNKKLFVAGLGLALFFMFGCSTPEKVSRMEGQGAAKIYNASYEATWKAAVDSAWALGLTVLRVYPKDGFISVKRGMTSTTFGEDVGIWLKEAGAGKTQVEVVSKQKGIPVFERKYWEEDIFRAIGERLGSAPIAHTGPPVQPGTAPTSPATASLRSPAATVGAAPQAPRQSSSAQGSAPGNATTIQAPGLSKPAISSATAAPAVALKPAPLVPTEQQYPALRLLRSIDPKNPSAAPGTASGLDPFTEQIMLREQLSRFLTSKAEDLKKETEPRRRQLIQYEMEYLQEELNKLDAKLSNVPK